MSDGYVCDGNGVARLLGTSWNCDGCPQCRPKVEVKPVTLSEDPKPEPAPVKGQSPVWSFIESFAGTVLSVVFSIAVNMVILPVFFGHVRLWEATTIVLIFAAISLVRNYFVRRFFNWIGK